MHNIRLYLDVAQFIVIIALGLAYAVTRLGRRSSPVAGEGQRKRAAAPADPYRRPFGDVPGLSREQCEYIARKTPDEPYQPDPRESGALRMDPAGDTSFVPSEASAGRKPFGWVR